MPPFDCQSSIFHIAGDSLLWFGNRSCRLYCCPENDLAAVADAAQDAAGVVALLGQMAIFALEGVVILASKEKGRGKAFSNL